MTVEHVPAELDSVRNLASLFWDRAAELGSKPLLWSKRAGAWHASSWSEVRAAASSLARGLRDLGIVPGDRVVIAMENRPEWAIAEIAIIAAGAVAVPAYTTNTAADHQHVLDNVRAKAALVSTRKLAASLLPAALRANSCEFVIAIEAPAIGQQPPERPIHLWSDVLARGNALPDEVDRWARLPERDGVAAII